MPSEPFVPAAFLPAAVVPVPFEHTPFAPPPAPQPFVPTRYPLLSPDEPGFDVEADADPGVESDAVSSSEGGAGPVRVAGPELVVDLSEGDRELVASAA